DGGDAEQVLGHLRREQVAVVALGEREEGVGAADAGLLENLLVEPGADQLVAVEAGRQAAEGIGVRVDNGDVVALTRKPGGERGSDASASHDDDSHGGYAFVTGAPATGLDALGVGRWIADEPDLA